MERKLFLIVGASALALSLLYACERSRAQPANGSRLVRLAELEIDPAHLEEYKAALREEIETSIRFEPGVLTLYAVSVKDNSSQIRILEMYADVEAYNAHLRTPHFLRYKTGTQGMVKSLKLIETDPIMLGARAQK